MKYQWLLPVNLHKQSKYFVRSFKPNPSSCLNHPSFTILQLSPLSQPRTTIFTDAVVKPIKDLRNGEMLGRSVRQSKIWRSSWLWLWPCFLAITTNSVTETDRLRWSKWNEEHKGDEHTDYGLSSSQVVSGPHNKGPQTECMTKPKRSPQKWQKLITHRFINDATCQL